MLNSAWTPSILTRPLTALSCSLFLISSPLLSQIALAESPKTISGAGENLAEFKETDYTLGSGDRIRLDILDNKDISGEYSILVDGTTTFPLVGALKVQNLTLTQLTDLLIQNYTRYIKRPVLTVGLVVPRPLKINIAGEINSPGAYTLSATGGASQSSSSGSSTLPTSTTGFPFLTDILKQAGGTTTVADISAIEVRRQYQGQEKIYKINLFPLLRKANGTQDISLRDGDSIFIPTKKSIDQQEVRELSNANFGIQLNRGMTVSLVGEIYRPGTYRLGGAVSTSGSTGTLTTGAVNDTSGSQAPRVSSALQKAGGTKPLADIRSLEVHRLTRSGEIQVIPVDLWALLQTGNVDQDILLQDGDTITVPKAQAIDPKYSEKLASASFAPDRITINVVGEVVKPGLMQLPPNTPLNQAILAAGNFNKLRADQDTVQLIRLNPNGTVSARDIKVDFSKGINDEHNPILLTNDVVVVNRSGLAAVTDTIGIILSPFTPAFSVLSGLNLHI